MPKNIVLFIDGTWNKAHDDGQPEDGFNSKNTNVRRLFRITTNDLPGVAVRQAAHYLPGVGSFLGIGGITGFGTTDRIKEAYSFLCEHYEKEDLIYLFGFSRGAFAARSLAGFIDRVGVLYRHRLDLLDLAYGYYAWEGTVPWEMLELHRREVPETPQINLNPEGMNMPVHFMGLWDTVKALGLPRTILRLDVLTNWFNSRHGTEMPRYVKHARHALSLHDLRENFEPLLFEGRTRPDQTLEQMWFAGAHSDVGGGYKNPPNSKDEYRTAQNPADFAFEWMSGQASSCGLLLDKPAPKLEPEQIVHAKIHCSNEGPFKAFPLVIRKVVKNGINQNGKDQRGLSFHPTVGIRLSEIIARDYDTFFPSPVVEALREVDQLTLQFLLQSVLGQNNRLSDATVKEVQNCRIDIRAFIGAEGPVASNQQKSFSRKLFLWLICGRDLAVAEFCRIVEDAFPKIEKFESKRHFHDGCERFERLRIGLEEFSASIARFTPGWFNKASIAEHSLTKLYNEQLDLISKQVLWEPIPLLKQLKF